MIKLRKILILSLLLLGIFFWSQFSVTAEPNCENPGSGDLDYCIAKIQKEIEALKPAQEANKKELSALNSKISNLTKQINGIANQITLVEKDIVAREADLAYAQKLFETKTSNYYRFLRLYDPLSPFLFSDNAADAFRELSLFQEAANGDRQSIIAFAQELVDLHTDKEALEKNKTDLAAAKAVIDKKAAFLAGEVKKVEAYITTLSSRQQDFLARKLGSLNLPRTLGSGPLVCTDDRNLDPRFSPAFAFYTFGIPHYVGMNQYGAYGRASFGGQDYRTILQAYYANTTIECRDVPTTIEVQGYGTLPFEEYVKGVVNKEMGADIPEALKAQAVAARSYALNQSQPICTTQYCQVYSSARRDAANVAVDATGLNICGAGKAEVLVSNGQIITAWYASTFGGYAHRSSAQLPNAGSTSYTKELTDAQGSINSFDDLFQKAYDRESKCFYAAQGWRKEYGNSAWLKPEEVADIVNTLNLVKRDPSTAEHLYQVDKPNPANTDTWSMEKVKQELQKYETPLNSVSSVSVSADFSSGRSTAVTVDGQNFSAQEFKDRFNLRAPANIQIVGPLFNVEKRQ